MWEYKDKQYKSFKNCFILITVSKSEESEWVIVGLRYYLMNQISSSPKEPYGLVWKKKKQDPVHYGKETRYYGTIRKADQRVFVPSEVWVLLWLACVSINSSL